MPIRIFIRKYHYQNSFLRFVCQYHSACSRWFNHYFKKKNQAAAISLTDVEEPAMGFQKYGNPGNTNSDLPCDPFSKFLVYLQIRESSFG
jgi:hypothetical protein